MSEPPPAPSPSGATDVGPEPITTGIPDCAPTEAGPAATEDTSISPTCESASIEAWSDEIESIDGDPQTWRKTWVMAAILALAGSAVGAALWFGHLAWPRGQSQSDSQSAQAPAPAPSPTPITNATPSPPPLAPAPTSAPAPAPTTTVTVQASPTVQAPPPPDVGISPEMVAWYDRQFIANLRYNGWVITNPVAMSRGAHKVCAMLQQGAAPGDVNSKMVAEVGIALNVAQQFTSTAMSTYPSCP